VLKSYLGKDIDFEDFAMNEEEKYRPIVEEIRAKARSNFESVRVHYLGPFRRLSFVLGNLIMVLKPRSVVFLGEGIVNEEMVRILERFVTEKFNSEFIGSVDFRLSHASWEEGVALATVRRFLPKVLLSSTR
jgi:predicted NBD/HSP70 family sugar kinase